ncbi:MAG: hypothetical protein AAGG08_00625 [Actinomycetota bacterium]
MVAVAFIGDATTTTTLAVTTTWRAADDVVLIEHDPRGGGLAAWFDMPLVPSLSSIVAATRRSDRRMGDGSSPATLGDRLAVFDSMTRRTSGGLRFVPVPFTEREARRSVAESTEALVPALIDDEQIIAVLDLGARVPSTLDATTDRADLAVVVHRQERAGARAAAARLERAAELVDAVRARRSSSGLPTMLAVVGDRPFEVDEIARHCDVPSADTVEFAHDPLAASVLAGGATVSPKRLRRQPLLRSSASAATAIAARLPLPLHVPDDLGSVLS